MARYTGKLVNTNTYNVKYYAPLDTRMLVPTYADLTTESNWLVDTDYLVAYNGMIVAVGSDNDATKNGVYYLFDAQNPGAKDEPVVTEVANWHKLCNLSELDKLEERIAALEGATGGVDEEAVNALIKTQVDALREEIAAAGYLTADDIADKAEKEHTHTLADITDYTAPDLSNLATKDELEAKAESNHTHNIVEIQGYTPTDLTGYATESYVDEQIDAKIAGKEVDLSGYYTKVETDAAITTAINSIPEASKNLSDYTNDAGFLTAVPEEFITTQELASYGYARQDVVNAHITEVENALGSKANTEHEHTLADLTDYVAPVIPTKVSQLENDAVYAYAADLNDYAPAADLNDVEGRVATFETDLANKADAADLEKLQTTVDSKADAEDLGNYYDKATIDQKLADVAAGGKVDLDGYATTEALSTTNEAVAAAQNEIDALETNVAENYATNDSVDAKIAAFQITYGSF